MLAVVDAEGCHACGICAATCPEVAIRTTSPTTPSSVTSRLMTEGVVTPLVGFYCRECAGAAIGLGGLRRDNYPANVRLVELPCLGRVSALHIVEAAGLALPVCSSPAVPRAAASTAAGDTIALEQAQVAADLLTDAGRPLPIELWHLCADRKSVGRRIRMFHARAVGDELHAAVVAQEMELIGATASAVDGCAGGEPCGCGR